MVAPTVANLDWIRHIHLFLGRTDDELAWALARMQEYVYQDGETILREGDPPNGMYFIREGAVEVLRGQRRLAVLERRDYFGEEALVIRRVRGRTATVRAVGTTRVFFLSLDDFQDLTRRFPQVKTFLQVVAHSRRKARQRQPNWLAPDEWIYLFVGKHPARLMADLWPSFLAFLVAALFFGLQWLTQSFVLQLLAILLGVGGVLLSIWYYIDWANDDYIVTNQRVVWIERVVLAYESRTEAPFRTILSLNVVRSLEGRMLGYGDVVIRTWFGSFALRNVGYADEIEAIIKEYWQRSREQTRKAERQAMLELLKERLGYTHPKPASAPPAKAASASRRPRFPFLIGLRRLFAERLVDGPVITYRKHWVVLVRRIWWQVLLGIPLALYSIHEILLHLASPSSPYALPLGVVSLTVVLYLVIQMLYNIWDWANDIYRLTADQVIDIERKPLGSEQKQSAPLESIQSLDHTRKGLLGLLLNYGDVHIRAGTATLIFHNVHKPDRVLQDIYQRMEERRRIKAAAEAQRERERMAEWLVTYHELIHSDEAPDESKPSLEPPPPSSHQP